MLRTKYSREEIAARGEEIYEVSIRSKVECSCRGQYLVLDLETRDYSIHPDDLTATKLALAKHPEGVLYGLRIGYPTAYRLGGFSKVPD